MRFPTRKIAQAASCVLPMRRFGSVTGARFKGPRGTQPANTIPLKIGSAAETLGQWAHVLYLPIAHFSVGRRACTMAVHVEGEWRKGMGAGPTDRPRRGYGGRDHGEARGGRWRGTRKQVGRRAAILLEALDQARVVCLWGGQMRVAL